MDEGNESPVLPEPADLENNLVDVPQSTSDSPNIPSQETNSKNIPASGLEDETSDQQLIDDNDTAADQTTDMVTDSATGDLLHETLSDTTAEDVGQLPDTEPDTNDSLNDSNLDDSVSENRKLTRPDQKTEKISQFPLGRVRDIMKADPDIKIVSGDCVFLVAKSTEMFLQRLGKEIHTVTLRNKKKTLQKRDLEAAISENAAFEFLEGALN